MDNIKRHPAKPVTLRPVSRTALTAKKASVRLLLADVEHRDNLSTASDMLEFMQTAFVTDDTGVMLSASAARGVGAILEHIQTVMVQHSDKH